MRTTRLPVVDPTDAPTDLNGLVRFAERQSLVSARVPSHFKRSLPINSPLLTVTLQSSVRATLVYNDTIYLAHSWRYNLVGLYLKMIWIYSLVRRAISTQLLGNTATSHRPSCRMIDRASLLDIVANKRNSLVAFLESKLPQIKV